MIKHLAATLLLVSGPALAAGENEIRFNHLGLDYLYSDLNGVDGDGIGADLNFALTSWLFVNFDYSTRTLDADGSDVDLEFFSGGLGGNYALNEEKSLQLFGTVTWEQLELEVDSGGGSDGGGDGGDGGDGGGSAFCTGTPLDQGLDGCSDTSGKALSATGDGGRLDGFGVNLGVRAIVLDNLEVNAFLGQRDYGDDYDDTLYGVGGNYAFGDWHVTAAYEIIDDLELEEWRLGVRYSFGKQDEAASIW